MTVPYYSSLSKMLGEGGLFFSKDGTVERVASGKHWG